MTHRGEVRLRETTRADIPLMFAMQLDPEGNRLAGTKPRDWATFEARWEEVLREAALPGRRIVMRMIEVDGEAAGAINIFVQDGRDAIGYWIAREQWGRGVATRAIALLLAEVPTRPLTAHVASHNVASRRALERNGFVMVSSGPTPETDRYVAGETMVLKLE